MQRPPLSDASFLAFTFSPSKNKKPTGLRKRQLTGTKNRRKARVGAYNNMPAEKQEVLRRSGDLESYLRGDITYTDAKRSLRQHAVGLGIVKPIRSRTPSHGIIVSAIDATILSHVQQYFGSNSKTNLRQTAQRLSRLPDSVKIPVTKADRATHKFKASQAEFAYQTDAGDINPYWYH